MTFIQPVPFGEAAFAALRERISAIQSTDPFAPVTVAVASNYVGLSLRRELAREGLVNVRFQVLPRVIELLGAPELAARGRTPLTPALQDEAIRRALDEAPGVFAPVAGHPGTQQALAATFADLRELPEETLDVLAGQSPRAASVVALFRAYRDATRGFYDHADAAEAAATAISAGSGSAALRDLGHLVVYLPRRLSPAEARVVAALSDLGRASVILGVTGDPDADSEAARIARMLGADLPPQELPIPHANRIVSAPDIEEEVRWVIRDLLARSGGPGSFARTAILYPQAEPYARVVHEQLAAAGIPAHGPSPRTLADTIAGRHILRLLALPQSDFRRADVMNWLASAPVCPGQDLPVTRWDEISRKAGISGGARQWRDRLNNFADDAREEQKRAWQDGRESLASRFATDAELARDLTEFVDDLVRRLEPGSRRTWRDLADWALELQRHYLGRGSDLDWPDESEVEAAGQVEELIEGLRALDAFEREASPALLRQALESLLAVPAGRAGSFGRGVFVGNLSTAAGMRLDRVYVLGMVEGRLPVRGHEDPLLPDRERDAAHIDPRLRPHEQRRDYLAALASAPERILLHPQANLRGQRELLPSRWLTEAASLLAGRPVDTSEFAKLTNNAWFTKIPSFRAGVLESPEPATAQERRMRRLHLPPSDPRHRAVLTEHPRLAAGLEAIRARMGNRYTPWDGVIGPLEALAPSPNRPTSPTSLEHWATCPMRYFLSSVLHVEEFERPEEELVITPLERGSLMHDILEEFFKSAGPREPGAAWTDDDRERLRQLTDAACDAAERRGIVGKPLLWHAERQRIHRSLQIFLDREADWREQGYRFDRAEFSFGNTDGRGPLVVELPDGRRVAFRGRIDRIDLGPNGSIAVYDYKTGKGEKYRPIKEPGTRTDHGERLQLPVYALAARRELGDESTPVEAYYWFVDHDAKENMLGYALDDDAYQQFARDLSLVLRGIENGLFPARSGEVDRQSFENCTYCPYDRLCPPDRHRAWERKSGDPVLEPLHELKGGQA